MRPPSDRSLLALAATPSGQEAMRLDAHIGRLRQKVGFTLLELYVALGGQGPFPIQILDALVKKRLGGITKSRAILSAERDENGHLIILINEDSSPSAAGKAVSAHMKREAEIVRWLKEGRMNFEPFPGSLMGKRGPLEDSLLEDCLIIMLSNAGRTPSEILPELQALDRMREKTAWNGRKQAGHDRVKTRIVRLRKDLGPDLVLFHPPRRIP